MGKTWDFDPDILTPEPVLSILQPTTFCPLDCNIFATILSETIVLPGSLFIILV